MRIETFKRLLTDYLLIRDITRTVEAIDGKMDWKDRLAKFLACYGRGENHFGTFKVPLLFAGFGTLATGLMLGWSPWIFVILGLVVFWINYTIGWADLIFGFWRRQNQWQTSINPFFVAMFKMIKEVYKILKSEQHLRNVIPNLLLELREEEKIWETKGEYYSELYWEAVRKFLDYLEKKYGEKK